MHKNKVIINGGMRLQCLTEDLQTEEQIIKISNDLKLLFSKQEVTRHSPEVKFISERPDDFMLEIILGYQTSESFAYLLFDTNLNKVIGLINLLPENTIEKNYPFVFTSILGNEFKKGAWCIQYYLDPAYWGNNIMTYFVNQILIVLFQQQAVNIFAFTKIENKNSEILLTKNYFSKLGEYNVETNPDLGWNLWGVGQCNR